MEGTRGVEQQLPHHTQLTPVTANAMKMWDKISELQSFHNFCPLHSRKEKTDRLVKKNLYCIINNYPIKFLSECFKKLEHIYSGTWIKSMAKLEIIPLPVNVAVSPFRF